MCACICIHIYVLLRIRYPSGQEYLSASTARQSCERRLGHCTLSRTLTSAESSFFSSVRSSRLCASENVVAENPSVSLSLGLSLSLFVALPEERAALPLVSQNRAHRFPNILDSAVATPALHGDYFLRRSRRVGGSVPLARAPSNGQGHLPVAYTHPRRAPGTRTTTNGNVSTRRYVKIDEHQCSAAAHARRRETLLRRSSAMRAHPTTLATGPWL